MLRSRKLLFQADLWKFRRRGIPILQSEKDRIQTMENMPSWRRRLLKTTSEPNSPPLNT